MPNALVFVPVADQRPVDLGEQHLETRHRPSGHVRRQRPAVAHQRLLGHLHLLRLLLERSQLLDHLQQLARLIAPAQPHDRRGWGRSRGGVGHLELGFGLAALRAACACQV